MIHRLIVAASLSACVMGCGDKKAPAPTAGSAGSASPSTGSAAGGLPPVPPGSGITLRADGDGTVVTDTVAGYEARLSGVPATVDAEPGPGGSGGARPAVTVYRDLPHGFVMLQLAPVRADQAPTTPALLATFYAGVQASMTGGKLGGGAIVDLVPTDVTIAGHAGRRLDARLDAGKRQGHVSATTVVIPEKLVAYTFLVVDGDAAAITDPVPLYSSLHASAP